MNLETIIYAKIFKEHRGKENAIRRSDLLEYARHFDPDITDRQLRAIYSGLPVCVCEEGIFYPIRTQEIEDFKHYLIKKISPMRERYYRVAKAHPELLPSGQMDLFKEAR